MRSALIDKDLRVGTESAEGNGTMRRETMTRRPAAGFTLIELLMVMAIMGIVLALGAPRLGVVRDRANMRSAKEQIAIAMSTARASAIQKGRQSRLHVDGNALQVTVDTNAVGSRMTVIQPFDLSTRFGTTMTVRNAADSVLRFDARGFANTSSGATARYVITKGTMTDSVCVTRFGVILKQGCAL